MEDRLIGWLIFVLISALVVIGVVAIRTFWDRLLNMSEEEMALERRISALNEGQANRRRDDEIVRLLRGDDQPIVRDDEK